MLLILTSEHHERQVVDIDRARLTIGRVAENDVQLADDKVSGHHAVIELQDDGRVVLHDLDSRNGTFVNDVRLAGPCILTGGERLRFGDQQLSVEAGPQGSNIETSQARTLPDTAKRAHTSATRRALPARLGKRGLALAIVAVAIAALIGVAQLVLPGVAEQRLRSDLARYAAVRRVHIESAPAIKLLWHRADRVEAVMDSYRSEPSGHTSLADFLSRTRDTGKLDVSVGTLHTQLLTLHDVRLEKEGDLLIGRARLTQHDLSAALPTFLGLRPVSASEDGIVAQVSASVLGHQVRARIRVLADGGRVLVRPEGFPFGALASIKVFDDPRVYVESFGATLRGEDYTLTARARLK
jgi:pSer/pThr/pTyr-binding forkhead associated (FHA) protein